MSGLPFIALKICQGHTLVTVQMYIHYLGKK